MPSALAAAPPPQRSAQPDLPQSAELAELARPVAAGQQVGWRQQAGDRLDWLKHARRERHSIASTTAAPARARSAWRAGYSAPPASRLPQLVAARSWRAD